MKEAMYYKKIKNNVQCQLCPNFCLIKPNEFGKCFVRKNIKGKLYATSYGKACSTSIDPIEKKPLFHFLPGTNTYSLATAGCNMHCYWCQNWQISQAKTEDVPYKELEPKEIVKQALETNCKSISYTYTEATIFYEYVLEIAKLAKKKNLKNIAVSNGYINKEPLEELYQHIDAVNIDLKGFNEQFYKKYCKAQLKPILETLINIKNLNVHLEVTNLIIPSLNDNTKEITKMCKWFVENLGEDTPLHFSRFFPMYKAKNIKPTSIKTLQKAYNIAKEHGIKYIYIGNIPANENTYCSECKKLLIERTSYKITNINTKGTCPKCKTKTPGIWK